MDHKSSDLQKTNSLLSKASAYLALHQNKGLKKNKQNPSNLQTQQPDNNISSNQTQDQQQDLATLSQEELIKQLQENLEELVNYALNPNQFFLESTGINKDISRETWSQATQSLVEMLISIGQKMTKERVQNKKALPKKKDIKSKKPLPVDDDEEDFDDLEVEVSKIKSKIKKLAKKKVEDSFSEEESWIEEEEDIKPKKSKKIPKNDDLWIEEDDEEYTSINQIKAKVKTMAKAAAKAKKIHDSWTEEDEEEELPVKKTQAHSKTR